MSSDRYALVTGGAQRVGRSIALFLAQKGYNIILHYNKSSNEAEETMKEIREFEAQVLGIEADLSSVDAITSMIGLIKVETEKLDLIVNSAATFHKQEIHEITINSWDSAMNVNVRAPFFIIQHSLNLLKNSEKPVIINIGDLSGVFAWRNFVQHGVSKSGIIHMTKILARELAPQIRVNCIIPGLIIPPNNLDEQDSRWIKMVETIPLAKHGGVEAINQTIDYILQTPFLTGSSITIDGGEALIGPANH
jgi:NAD(P)-dependent dehydrogenase (short-subunit alcohol dehydrogenase family)